MGCCASRREEAVRNDGQYESLVLTKPPPITLRELRADSDDGMDMPVFPPAQEDEPVGSDPDSLTDQELNIYTSKLSQSD
jgi:hypothetical protein